MPDHDIRPATKADLPAVTGIYEHAVLQGTATFELVPPDLAEMTRRFNALVDGGFPYLAAARGRGEGGRGGGGRRRSPPWPTRPASRRRRRGWTRRSRRWSCWTWCCRGWAGGRCAAPSRA